MQEVKIIKKPPPSNEFDGEIAIIDTRNYGRLAKLHLSRCDDADIAEEIANTLSTLSGCFASKSLALKNKIV